MSARSTTVRDRDRAAIRRTKPPCGICLEPINYTLRSPDPLSFEVDHIIPFIKGGPDTLDNKQASHRVCNREKWHRMPEQLGPRTFETWRVW